MTSADSKGEKILAALAAHKNCELTQDGSNYIVQRFDPYHDKPIRPVGYPDSFNGHTVSRCIKKTMTFSQTTGGAAPQTTPFDVHIVMTPIAKPVNFTNTISRNNNTFTFNPTASPSAPYGGLIAVAVMNSGSSAQFPVLTASNLLGQLNLADADLADNMRVTSMGFEVIDGTAELYRQGILTCYRQNQSQHDTNFFKGVSNENSGAANRQAIEQTMQCVRLPPVNASNALLFPDSKQWKTSEGAYVDIDFNTSELPMLQPSFIAPYLIDDDAQSPMPINNESFWFPQTGFNISGVTNPIPGTAGVGSEFINSAYGQRIYPINQTGVILTGLNPLATITVNAIYYVECAPTSDDQELLSLASQSPALDDYALMIISKLRRDSPIAVKRRENYTGEWFFNGIRDVINKVSPWLSNISYVGSQVGKWIDRAGTNDGLINPQTFVKGSVAKKIASEKKSQPRIPKAPGRAPMAPRKSFKAPKGRDPKIWEAQQRLKKKKKQHGDGREDRRR